MVPEDIFNKRFTVDVDTQTCKIEMVQKVYHVSSSQRVQEWLYKYQTKTVIDQKNIWEKDIIY